jgi:ferredoxin-NADP reductase
VYITAFLLVLIVAPIMPAQLDQLPALIWIAVWAMASKYIFAITKKHLFNPAAFAVALSAVFIGQSANWWVGGNIPMITFVVLGGLLVVRKMRRADLVTSFFIGALVSISLSVLPAGDPLASIKMALLHAPVFFFAFALLTEPLTTPPTRLLRIVYGLFVGLLFAPSIHVGSVYSTPELALLVGNIFSYVVSPKAKYRLRLKEIVTTATDTFDYVFTPDRPARFRPGQYFELTLAHEHPDARGNRRYLTIASSPTEPEMHFGVKFYPASSSFKKALAALPVGGELVVGQLAGDFTLPKDPKQKLVFIAGGIGVTPFRSMVKYLLDTQDKRTVTLFYSNKTIDEIAYKEVFDQAEKELDMRVVYTLSEAEKAPADWTGCTGFLNKEMIIAETPDYRERMFYLSGPHGMVTVFEKMLRDMGVPRKHIHIDFFPGYA